MFSKTSSYDFYKEKLSKERVIRLNFLAKKTYFLHFPRNLNQNIFSFHEQSVYGFKRYGIVFEILDINSKSCSIALPTTIISAPDWQAFMPC